MGSAWIGQVGSPEVDECRPRVFRFASRQDTRLFPGIIVIAIIGTILAIPLMVMAQQAASVLVIVVYCLFLSVIGISFVKMFWFSTQHEIDCIQRQITVSYCLLNIIFYKNIQLVSRDDFFAIATFEPQTRSRVYFNYVLLCDQQNPKLCVVKIVSTSPDSTEVGAWVQTYASQLDIRFIGYKKISEIATMGWRLKRMML